MLSVEIMSWAQCDQICVYTLNLKLWVLWNDNSYAEILTTNVTVFRTRTFRKKSGEVSRVQVVSGDLRRPQKTFQEEEKPSPSPCEDRVGRQPSPSPEGSSQQNLLCLTTWRWTSSPQNCDEISFYCLRQLAYCILLWQLELTKITWLKEIFNNLWVLQLAL